VPATLKAPSDPCDLVPAMTPRIAQRLVHVVKRTGRGLRVVLEPLLRQQQLPLEGLHLAERPDEALRRGRWVKLREGACGTPDTVSTRFHMHMDTLLVYPVARYP